MPAARPQLLHLLLLHTHDHRHRLALGCHPRAPQHSHPAARSEQICGFAPLALGRFDTDHTAETNDVLKAKLLGTVELDVREAAIGHDGDPYPWGSTSANRPSSSSSCAFRWSLSAERVTVFDTAGAAAVLGLGPEHDDRLIGVLKLGPVEVHDQFLTLGDHEAHPAGGDFLRMSFGFDRSLSTCLIAWRGARPLATASPADGPNSRLAACSTSSTPSLSEADTLRMNRAAEHLIHQLVDSCAQPSSPPSCASSPCPLSCHAGCPEAGISPDQ